MIKKAIVWIVAGLIGISTAWASKQKPDLRMGYAREFIASQLTKTQRSNLERLAKDASLSPETYLLMLVKLNKSFSDFLGTGARVTVEQPSVGAVMTNSGDDVWNVTCSGTLIAPRIMLSAAHCFCEHNDTRYKTFDTCKKGSFYLSNNKSAKALSTSWRKVFFQNEGFFEIDKIVLFPKYKLPYGDLSIIVLKTRLKNVTPSLLNTSALMSVGAFGTGVGFGRYSKLNSLGEPTDKRGHDRYGLKTVWRVRTSACSDKTKGLICWKYASKSVSDDMGNTCNGDSGGPLYYKTGGREVLAGVTSAGKLDDCGPGDFSWDTEVYEFRDWIKVEIKKARGQSNGTRPLGKAQNNMSSVLFKGAYLILGEKKRLERKFTTTDGVRRIRVSVNSNKLESGKLELSIRNPGGKLVCSDAVRDMAVSCDVSQIEAGEWTIQVAAPLGQEIQILAVSNADTDKK